MSPATVSTPPTMAHVDVKKCAKDCRDSRWMTSIGEISYCPLQNVRTRTVRQQRDSKGAKPNVVTYAKENTWDTSKAMCSSMTSLFRGCIALAEISLVACNRVLMRSQHLLIDSFESRRDNFQKVLEHVVAFFSVRLDAR